MTEWKAKRFWKEVDVVTASEGFAIHLDARPVRTPAKAPLIVPTRAFAEVVAQEWRDQGEVLNPQIMPATRTANVAIDKVSKTRSEVVAHLVEYGGSDLLCYRAHGPEELVTRQAAAWDSLLAWVEQEFGASLRIGQGVMPISQPAQTLEIYRAELIRFDVFELSAFHELVSLSGSLVLAFAVARGWAAPSRAWELSRLDEQYQIEQWGDDEEAAEAAALKQVAFETAADLLDRLQQA